MTHHHLTGWNMPALSDGDVIDGVNLSQDKANTPMLQDVTAKVTITNSNVWNCIFPPNVTVDLATCAYGQRDKEPTIEAPTTNPLLSAKATIVYSALKGSGQLDSQKLAALGQLTDMVDGIAGTKVELGEAATALVIDLINELLSIGKEEEAGMIKQMLQAVQAEWSVE